MQFPSTKFNRNPPDIFRDDFQFSDQLTDTTSSLCVYSLHAKNALLIALLSSSLRCRPLDDTGFHLEFDALRNAYKFNWIQ
jgi:hypothetical protein